LTPLYASSELDFGIVIRNGLFRYLNWWRWWCTFAKKVVADATASTKDGVIRLCGLCARRVMRNWSDTLTDAHLIASFIKIGLSARNVACCHSCFLCRYCDGIGGKSDPQFGVAMCNTLAVA
jgi:hypothetical protein